jgi:hypothetical protein
VIKYTFKKDTTMLNKIKDFISQKSTELTSPAPVVIVPETSEQKVITQFQKFTEEMRVHESFPKRGIQSLENILKTLSEMDSQTIALQEQVLIRKIVERDIPQMVELYFSLPKAHAVSFILENGKTSKDTLIDKLITTAKQVENIWELAVVEKTNLLIKKQKTVSQPSVAKKDFFDM